MVQDPLTGGVKLFVSNFYKHESDSYLKFEIIDTGIGIPKHLQDQLFREFHKLTILIQSPLKELAWALSYPRY